MKNPFILILYFSIIAAVIILGLLALKNFNLGGNREASNTTQIQNKEIVYPKNNDIVITEAEINENVKTKLPADIKNVNVDISNEHVTLNGEYVKIIPLKFVVVGTPELVDGKLEITVEKAEILGAKIPNIVLDRINNEITKNLSSYTNGNEITNIRLEENKIILNLKEQ